mgnify:FL=1|jgi:hypothetical protein|tara:strand:- start:1736 stop:2893 length:1158 start_codon:yes stop_codon:yes gene_type:complete
MNLLLPMAFASQLTVPETSYVGATILEGDVDVTFEHITNLNYELDTKTYAFFEGNTMYVGNSDQYGNSVDAIIEFFWFQSSIDRGSDFYVAVVKTRATPGRDCPGWESLWLSRDCELWADDLFDWGEFPVLSVEAVTDATREAGAFRWDWAVPFENYGIDAYGQVTFSNQYGIGLNAEGAIMAHGEIPLDESGTVKAAGNVQTKGFVNSDYMVQTQYEVTLYEWDVYVNGRADLMAWDTYLNLGARANQSAYHEYFISIQVEEGETFLLDELNFSAHFDTGNLNPFASELGLSVQDIEISAPYWEPENNEESEWSYDNEEEEEQVFEEDDITIVPITTEDDPTIDEEVLSLDPTPIQSGCNTSTGWLWAWFLALIPIAIRTRRDS